jgi:hypothetical protein
MRSSHTKKRSRKGFLRSSNKKKLQERVYEELRYGKKFRKGFLTTALIYKSAPHKSYPKPFSRI